MYIFAVVWNQVGTIWLGFETGPSLLKAKLDFGLPIIQKENAFTEFNRFIVFVNDNTYNSNR